MRRQVGHRRDQPVDVLGGVGQPEAHADRRGRDLAPRVLEELVDENVCAELAVSHADAVLGGQDRGHE